MYNIPVGIPVTFIHSCCSAYTYSSLQGAFKVGIVVIISSNPDWLNRTVSFSVLFRVLDAASDLSVSRTLIFIPLGCGLQ